MDGSKTTKRKHTKRQVTPVTSVRTPVMMPLRYILGAAANIKDTGPITGVEYTFHPGQITYVDARDYEGLLARRTNPKSCCGGQSPPAPQPMYGTA